jgi:aldehyde dehydrogenase (NAD+)
MTFRTPAEAVALANNTRYGLAASVWSENINLALDIAPKLKAGTVWVNCTNLFDASSGFGGYRESGFGREGGKEGLYEYVRPAWEVDASAATSNGEKFPIDIESNNGTMHTLDATDIAAEDHFEWRDFERDDGEATSHPLDSLNGLPAIDRTPKMFINGKQVRPDSGYSREIYGSDGTVIGQVGEGNRKDIRNAVEAAHAASGWATGTTHNRAQILYYIAENLAARENEFARRLVQQTGCSYAEAGDEVQAALSRLFSYAAWTDKFEGTVHRPPMHGVTLAMHEAIGVIGIACPDEYPLLGFVSLIAPAIAMGNTVVVIPSESSPLSATDFYQVLETSDLPDGVVNIVTGERDTLSQVLADHDDVEAMWYFGSAEGSKLVEYASAGNMKRTWVNYGQPRNWLDAAQGEGEEFLREATHIKNTWVPYGE